MQLISRSLHFKLLLSSFIVILLIMMGLASYQIRSYTSERQEYYISNMLRTLQKIENPIQPYRSINKLVDPLIGAINSIPLPMETNLIYCSFGSHPQMIASLISNETLSTYVNRLCLKIAELPFNPNQHLEQHVVKLHPAGDFFMLRSHRHPLTGYSLDRRDLVLLMPKASFDKDVSNYIQQTILRTIAHYIFILFFLIITTRWSLRSLTRITRQIGEIRTGKRVNLSDDYELELMPLTSSLNKLLQNERQQRTRYQNSMNDLAHSLKTRLALIRITTHEQGISTSATQQLDEQIMTMTQIVQYQLRRAVAGRQGLSAQLTDIEPLIRKLVSSLQKVYRDKKIQVEMMFAQDNQLLADPDDMMELFGNLLDNAFKFTIATIRISVIREDNNLIIKLEDDGPGIPTQHHERVLQRGVRADSSSGQGIGMAVVSEIVDSYAGELSIADSELGGALIRIKLCNS